MEAFPIDGFRAFTLANNLRESVKLYIFRVILISRDPPPLRIVAIVLYLTVFDDRLLKDFVLLPFFRTCPTYTSSCPTRDRLFGNTIPFGPHALGSVACHDTVIEVPRDHSCLSVLLLHCPIKFILYCICLVSPLPRASFRSTSLFVTCPLIRQDLHRLDDFPGLLGPQDVRRPWSQLSQ